MSALQNFLAEIRADPKVSAALARGEAGEAGEALSDIEQFFALLETRVDAPAFELHDKLAGIVRRRTPLADRLIAVSAIMTGELPGVFDALDTDWRSKFTWRPTQELQ